MLIWTNIGIIAGAIIGIGTILIAIFAFVYKHFIKRFSDDLVCDVMKKVEIKFIESESTIKEIKEDIKVMQENGSRRIKFNRSLINSILLLLRKVDGEQLNGEIKEDIKVWEKNLVNNIL
jgi:hypothetical protein